MVKKSYLVTKCIDKDQIYGNVKDLSYYKGKGKI